MEIEPIGVVHSCYSEKFGIPRQAGLVGKARASIEMYSRFGRQEMFKELMAFSHIWVQFLFHEAQADGWKATVRPPWLGGRQRVGVFASRSPHRPNHIGMSAVRLLDVSFSEAGVRLEVGGGDFVDGTPVIDIRPYIPYSDAIVDAGVGFSGRTAMLEVCLTEEAATFCRWYAQTTDRDLEGLIKQVLAQDPRPASQRGREKCFGIQLWDVNIRWQVEADVVRVLNCYPVNNTFNNTRNT